MSPARSRPMAAASAALALSLSLLGMLAGGCIKEKDSLIVVAITADDDLATADQLDLSVGTLHQTYAVAGIGRTDPVRRGIYVDSKIVGDVTVQVGLRTGAPCLLYNKTGSVHVPSAGATVQVAIKLSLVGPCAGGGGGTDAGNDTGSAIDAPSGVGGSNGGGTGGRADAGAGGAGGRADAGADARVDAGTNGGPSLASCIEFNHAATTDCTTDNPTIYSVAVSPNGQLVATGGDDLRAKIWRFDGKNLVAEGHVLPGTGGYGMLSWSPDGSILAVGWSTGIDLWNTTTWTRLRTLLVTGSIYDLSFTPDGTQIMSIDSATLYVHNITTPAALHTLAIPENTWYMAVSPVVSATPAVAVATQAGTVRVFTHSATGFALAGSPLVVNSSGAHALSIHFSRDGRYIAAGNGGGQVLMWSYPITTTTPSAPTIDVGTPTLSDDVNALAFSPDNLTLAVGGGFFQSISTWSVAAPRANIATNINPSSDLFAITYSPNGKAIIGGEFDCGKIVVCAD